MHRGPGAPKLQSLILKGTGTFAGFGPASLAFGDVPVGTQSQPQTVTLTNLSTTVTLQNIQIATFGANRVEFQIPTSTCNNGPRPMLAPGASCSVTVVFAPQGTGSRNARLKVQLSGTPVPSPIQLSGNGT